MITHRRVPNNGAGQNGAATQCQRLFFYNRFLEITIIIEFFDLISTF